MPVCVMTCDLQDFKINYVNKASLKALANIEHVLPIKAAEIMGQSIDVFHKVPERQRTLLRDRSNLPYNTIISVGDEKLDLLITELSDSEGRYTGAMLTWSIVTDKIKQDNDNSLLRQMLDEIPVNVMAVDKDTLELSYLNKTSMDTLRSVQHLLPIPVDQLPGTCIDAFHKTPSHQRALLGNPANLPYQASINLGDQSLSLRAAAVHDTDGNYKMAMATWSVVTEHVAMADNLEQVATSLTGTVSQLESSAQNMKENAVNAQHRTTGVAAASEELSTTISQVAQQCHDAVRIADTAMEESTRSVDRVNSLATSVQKIDEVSNMIQEIAAQTNLLALNATIEAARAGEAGKGFAVVAGEVKALANQTAEATLQISHQIADIQKATSDAVESNEMVGRTIEQINEFVSAIAHGMEQQSIATTEVNENISAISETSALAERVSSDVLDTANGLTEDVTTMQKEVGLFIESTRL